MAAIPPVPPGTPIGSYQWADWYEKVRKAINDAANIAYSQITSFVGSNLLNLETRNHNDLQNIQGGKTNKNYHLFDRGNATLTAGNITVANSDVTVNTIVIHARKTAGGTLGFLTYTVNSGVGFTITSTSATDTSVVSYILTEG